MLCLAALGTTLLAPSLVRADIELGHTGQTGRHRLADMHDSPGAVCDVVLPGHDSLGETWLRVNPPIIFANDRTSGEDEQPVGWQATVSALDERSGDWREVRRSQVFRDLATDDLASYFNGQGWLAAFPVSRGTYAVKVDMLWFVPAEPFRVEGRASHAIEYFIVILRHQGEVSHGRTAAHCGAPR